MESETGGVVRGVRGREKNFFSLGIRKGGIPPKAKLRKTKKKKRGTTQHFPVAEGKT